MTQEEIKRAKDLLLHIEGGITHHVEGDPGGRTSRIGIIQKTYDSWRTASGLEPQKVDFISEDEENQIIENWWWRPCRCDIWEDGIDLAVFHYAWNRRPSVSIKILQSAAGAKPDGNIGDLTIAAVLCTDRGVLLEGIFDRQVDWYLNKRKKDKFTNGLVNRVIKVSKFIEFQYSPSTE